MSKPRLLDLFCGAGGAGYGYHAAGFDVIGVDWKPQPNYPFLFIQEEAIKFLKRNTRGYRYFDAIHASPPCQRYTRAGHIRQGHHAPFIAETRALLVKSALPYVIENVMGASLKKSAFYLCGEQFGLRVYRHRLFETNFPVELPFWRCQHNAPIAKMGRPVKDDEFMHVVGNFSDTKRAGKSMGISWMKRDELREAIPPAYTEFIGQYLIKHLEVAA